jgi:hypothetical protein
MSKLRFILTDAVCAFLTICCTSLTRCLGEAGDWAGGSSLGDDDDDDDDDDESSEATS